jgi:hypothetical protein
MSNINFFRIMGKGSTAGVCCGDIVFRSSNYTNDDYYAYYYDCSTGNLLGTLVPSQTADVTVYGRVICGVNSFDITQYRNSGTDSYGDTTFTYTIYSLSNVLGVGSRVYETSALNYTVSHGTIFFKEIATGRVWQVDNNGLIIAEYTV